MDIIPKNPSKSFWAGIKSKTMAMHPYTKKKKVKREINVNPPNKLCLGLIDDNGNIQFFKQATH